MTSFHCPNGHANANPSARFCQSCGLPLVATSLGDPSPNLAATSQAAEAGGEPLPPAHNLLRPSAPPLACARHPERGAVPCPRCGTFACAECLLRLPDGSELCVDCSARESDLLPWDRREELGTLRAFWQTCIRIITRPTLAFGTSRPAGTLGSSLWFGTLTQLAGISSTLALYVLMFGVMGIAILAGDKKPDGPGGAEAAIFAAVLVGMFLLTLGMIVVGLLLTTALDHLVLKLVDAQPKSFSVSLRAASLAQAPALTGLIPLCSLYVWPIWALVLKVFAYRAFHQTTWGKAALGALLVPGIFIALGVVFYALLIVLAGTGALEGL